MGAFERILEENLDFLKMTFEKLYLLEEF